MPTLLDPPTRTFACPSCTEVRRSDEDAPMHRCRGLGTLLAPLVAVPSPDAKPDARHRLVEREDYARTPGASRYASLATDHGDGQMDCTVYAPTALAAGRAFRTGAGLSIRPVASGATFHAFQPRFRHDHRFRDPVLGEMARVAKLWDARMAGWVDSLAFAYFLENALTAKLYDIATDTLKCAIFTNSVTPAQSTTAALTQYAGASSTWSTSNEASGTGYTAGGQALSSVTWTQAAGTTYQDVTLSSTNPQWTSVTLSAVYGCLCYDSTENNQGITANYFGGTQSVTAGTFTIDWSTSDGIASAIMQLQCAKD